MGGCGDGDCDCAPLTSYLKKVDQTLQHEAMLLEVEQEWKEISAALWRDCGMCSDGAGEASQELEKVLGYLTENRGASEGGEAAPEGEGMPPRPLGLPLKEGLVRASLEDWKAVAAFIAGEKWYFDTPPPECEGDGEDPLLKIPTGGKFGAFMLGFDFHLTPEGPRLIEINTNAGGLASTFALQKHNSEKRVMELRWAYALCQEYYAARVALGEKDPPRKPGVVAIVDVDCRNQGLYKEMCEMASLLQQRGIKAYVRSPEDLTAGEDGSLWVTPGEGEEGEPGTPLKVDFMYNRTVDFRFKEEAHAHLRAAAVKGTVVISPHPMAYVRIADKRNLIRLWREHGEDPTVAAVCPPTFHMSDRPADEWYKTKKQWVFKPPEGQASKGVYRGDKISRSKFDSFDPEHTIVQQFCPPSSDEDDGSKYDLRVYTLGTEVLGMISRQFTGQVMEMRSKGAGLKAALPNGMCCLPMVFLLEQLGSPTKSGGSPSLAAQTEGAAE